MRRAGTLAFLAIAAIGGWSCGDVSKAFGSLLRMFRQSNLSFKADGSATA